MQTRTFETPEAVTAAFAAFSTQESMAVQVRQVESGYEADVPDDLAEKVGQPAPPKPLPDISDRQFGEGLWHDGLISFDDYIKFVGPGTIPPPLQTIIDTLPDDDTGNPTPRKVALGTVTGATTYRFDNDLVEAVRATLEATDPKWTVAYLRERWTVWATL